MKEIKKINHNRERAVLGTNKEEILLLMLQKGRLKAEKWPYSKQHSNPTLD